MAPKNLLRYIFRHGPHSKARTAVSPTKPTAHISETDSPPQGEPISPQPLVLTDDTPESPLAYKSRPESRQSSILEDIVEENSSEIDNASIAETLALPDLHINAFTTRGLIIASVDEARIANHAHLETINTILALLVALEGFSATIGVLSVEMEEKQRACEEKLAMLEDVERAVIQMHFEDEDFETAGSAGQ